MSGRNLFPTGPRMIFTEKRAAATPTTPCVFISYRTADRPIASFIANILMRANIDIFYDQTDASLAIAVASQNDIDVAQSIEMGLDRSTHLIGVLSPRVVGSLWVPYEIGGARGRGRAVAHLVTPDVPALPSWYALGETLWGQDDVARWIGLIAGSLNEGQVVKSASASWLPAHRNARFV